LLKKLPLLLLPLLLTAADRAKVKLPAPYATPSASNASKLIPQPAGAKLTVPPGFKAEEWGSGFKKPRFMVQLSSGTVLVSDSVPEGSVIAVTNGTQKPLITGLDRPSALALWKDYLYVAEAEAIKRYKLDVAAVSVGAPEMVVPLKGYGKGHWTRALAFDKKGERLYVGIGSGSNVDLGDPEDRNAINSYNPDGSNRQLVANGLRNPVTIRFNPVNQQLWATVQERDGLGDGLVPDFFTSIGQGKFYGWPYAYIGANEEPRHKGVKPEMVAKSVEPDVVLPAHAAVMDFIFYTGKQFPAKYRNGAFLVYRGSANRSDRLGYSINFLPFKGGKPVGEPEEFLAGFMVSEKSKDVWGRPVGILQLNDGSLLLSEDGNNKIFRISYAK
jgi:glucose/arabinose dehydrogenase